MNEYDEECLQVFLGKQLQLFQEEVATTPEEAEEFLSDCMAVICKDLKDVKDFFDEEVFDSDFWLYWRTMFAFENWHSALEMKLYIQRFIHHIGGLPDFSALKFTKYNQYESLILPMQKYLEDAGVDFQFNTEVTNVIFEFKDGKKIASAIECKVNGVEKGIVLTENDLVFVTNGSCTEGTIYGDQNHAPNGDAEVRTSGCWNLWKNIAKQDPAFGHPEKFCSDVAKTNWESATITTLDDKIIPYITTVSYTHLTLPTTERV